LFCLNGVNITDPQTGHHNLNLPVDFQQSNALKSLKGRVPGNLAREHSAERSTLLQNRFKKSFIKAEASAGQFAYNAQKISAGLKTSNSSQLLSGLTNGHRWAHQQYRLSSERNYFIKVKLEH
jgi:vitamin B12 transporter